MGIQKPKTKAQRRARREAMQQLSNLEVERRELNTMLDAVRRDADQFFKMGRFSAKRTLSNGAVVRISITMPPREVTS